MKKYYLMAINKGDSNSMILLANYFESNKDHENMIKYFLMAVNKGNTTAMISLAQHFRENKDYDDMMKYCLMALQYNKNDTITMSIPSSLF